MTLHSDYQTLLRRGMPEIKRLGVYLYANGNADWSINDLDYDQTVPLTDDETADLITMAAIRWVHNKCADGDVHIEHLDGTGWGISSCYDYDNKQFIFGDNCYGATILAAIIAATEHLEKK